MSLAQRWCWPEPAAGSKVTCTASQVMASCSVANPRVGNQMNKPVEKELKRAVIRFPSFLWALSIWSPALRRAAANWAQCSSRDPDWHQMEQHN
ncbi:hypothetical protein EK904_005916 [Melospiza melodia maxima]|nr:hypothetical protein EK904_005916 [Melospiza melodia maxima]